VQDKHQNFIKQVILLLVVAPISPGGRNLWFTNDHLISDLHYGEVHYNNVRLYY